MTQNQCTANLTVDEVTYYCHDNLDSHPRLEDGEPLHSEGPNLGDRCWTDKEPGSMPHGRSLGICNATTPGHLGEELGCTLEEGHTGPHKDGLYRWDMATPPTPQDAPGRCPATTTREPADEAEEPFTVQCHMAVGGHTLNALDSEIHVASYTKADGSDGVLSFPDMYRTDDTVCQATVEADGVLVRCTLKANQHTTNDRAQVIHQGERNHGTATWSDTTNHALTTMGGQAIPAKAGSFATPSRSEISLPKVEEVFREAGERVTVRLPDGSTAEGTVQDGVLGLDVAFRVPEIGDEEAERIKAAFLTAKGRPGVWSIDAPAVEPWRQVVGALTRRLDALEKDYRSWSDVAVKRVDALEERVGERFTRYQHAVEELRGLVQDMHREVFERRVMPDDAVRALDRRITEALAQDDEVVARIDRDVAHVHDDVQAVVRWLADDRPGAGDGDTIWTALTSLEGWSTSVDNLVARHSSRLDGQRRRADVLAGRVVALERAVLALSTDPRLDPEAKRPESDSAAPEGQGDTRVTPWASETLRDALRALEGAAREMRSGARSFGDLYARDVVSWADQVERARAAIGEAVQDKVTTTGVQRAVALLQGLDRQYFVAGGHSHPVNAVELAGTIRQALGYLGARDGRG